MHSLDARSRASSLCAVALRVRRVTRESRRSAWSSNMGRMAAKATRSTTCAAIARSASAPNANSAAHVHRRACPLRRARRTPDAPPPSHRGADPEALERRARQSSRSPRVRRASSALRAGLLGWRRARRGSESGVRAVGLDQSGGLYATRALQRANWRGIASSSLPALHLRSQPAPVRTHCRRAAAVRALPSEI